VTIEEQTMTDINDDEFYDPDDELLLRQIERNRDGFLRLNRVVTALHAKLRKATNTRNRLVTEAVRRGIDPDDIADATADLTPRDVVAIAAKPAARAAKAAAKAAERAECVEREAAAQRAHQAMVAQFGDVDARLQSMWARHLDTRGGEEHH
jgi:2-C-methyl-D-erythritol 4-phosphate cytidylyltransferase